MRTTCLRINGFVSKIKSLISKRFGNRVGSYVRNCFVLLDKAMDLDRVMDTLMPVVTEPIKNAAPPTKAAHDAMLPKFDAAVTATPIKDVAPSTKAQQPTLIRKSKPKTKASNYINTKTKKHHHPNTNQNQNQS